MMPSALLTYLSQKKHSIKYKWDPFNRKKPPNPISVKELADESEDSDSEEVHLHHSFTCKLVDLQNELDVEMGSESGGQGARARGGE